MQSDLKKARADIFAMIDRKRQALERTESRRIKTAIETEIRILEFYRHETEQEIKALQEATREAKMNEDLFARLAAIHGIDLQLWAMRGPQVIFREWTACKKDDAFFLSEGASKYIRNHYEKQ